MIRVVIIGSGNVAQHLIWALLQSTGTQIVQGFSRRKETLGKFSDSFDITDKLNDLVEADVYIIAVSDDAIADVSKQIPFQDRLVVHTSGGVSIDALSSDRKGVFYPLQTFSINKPVDFKSIPICLETNFADDLKLLEQVARAISGSIYNIDSQQRKALHVAAVFVNNFTNHLYKLGNDICTANQIPFEILQPLIQETAQKIMTLAPSDAQTGPARRHDSTTIKAHLEFLSDENQKNIYTILTQSIQNGEKL